MRGRKFEIHFSSSITLSSDGIFHQVSTSCTLHYVGIYNMENSICMYIHTKNMVSCNGIKNTLESMGIVIEKISVCTEFKGDKINEYGTLLKRGGYRKRKRESRPPPPPVPKLDVSEVQPPPPSTKPRFPNGILIHDEIYVNKTYGEATPDMFHAVWSSTNGLWSPHMWVGPIRNIFPVPRGNIKPHVIHELLEEQDSLCRLCKTPVFMGTYSNSDVDHIVPLRHGGTCRKSNLQILCVTCHRRKTALECKKVYTLMGPDKGPDSIKWDPNKVYLGNTHVHYEPDLKDVRGINPKEFLETIGFNPGLFVLEF